MRHRRPGADRSGLRHRATACGLEPRPSRSPSTSALASACGLGLLRLPRPRCGAPAAAAFCFFCSSSALLAELVGLVEQLLLPGRVLLELGLLPQQDVLEGHGLEVLGVEREGLVLGLDARQTCTLRLLASRRASCRGRPCRSSRRADRVPGLGVVRLHVGALAGTPPSSCRTRPDGCSSRPAAGSPAGRSGSTSMAFLNIGLGLVVAALSPRRACRAPGSCWARSGRCAMSSLAIGSALREVVQLVRAVGRDQVLEGAACGSPAAFGSVGCRPACRWPCR